MRQEPGQPVSLDVPLSVSLLSAALCLWIAGGQPDAWFKFWMIVGGLALYGILVHLRTAPGQRATRQLLGEGTAIAGDVTQASALWRTVDVSRQQLVLR